MSRPVRCIEWGTPRRAFWHAPPERPPSSRKALRRGLAEPSAEGGERGDGVPASDGARGPGDAVPRSVFDDVALEDVTIGAPAIRVELSVAEALDGGQRHMQCMVRIVVCIESLPSERQHALESADPAIDLIEVLLVTNPVNRVAAGRRRTATSRIGPFSGRPARASPSATISPSSASVFDHSASPGCTALLRTAPSARRGPGAPRSSSARTRG